MFRRNRKTKIPNDARHRERTAALDLAQLVNQSPKPYVISYVGEKEEGHCFLLHQAEWGKPMRTFRVLVREL